MFITNCTFFIKKGFTLKIFVTSMAFLRVNKQKLVFMVHRT